MLSKHGASVPQLVALGCSGGSRRAKCRFPPAKREVHQPKVRPAHATRLTAEAPFLPSFLAHYSAYSILHTRHTHAHKASDRVWGGLQRRRETWPASRNSSRRYCRTALQLPQSYAFGSHHTVPEAQAEHVATVVGFLDKVEEGCPRRLPRGQRQRSPLASRAPGYAVRGRHHERWRFLLFS